VLGWAKPEANTDANPAIMSERCPIPLPLVTAAQDGTDLTRPAREASQHGNGRHLEQRPATREG
jgi:hypothetical protein